MAFEIQELPDVIRIILLLFLSKDKSTSKAAIKRRLDRVCSSLACVNISELDKALKEMSI